MSKLDKYLSKNYKKLKEVSDKITSCKYVDSDDLLHDTILALYDSDEEKINKLIDRNQYINNTPDRIHRVIQEDGIQAKKQFEKDLKKINKKLKEIHWFDSECFRIYTTTGMSLNEFSKQCGINRNTLYKSIVKVKKIFNGQK